MVCLRESQSTVGLTKGESGVENRPATRIIVE